MSGPSTRVAALLLTGGASRRMGRDKSGLAIDGVTLARRTAGLLERVSAIALEVGPGTSGLWSTSEVPGGEGPLVAIAAGRRALRERGHEGDALVVACDLPLVTEDLLRFLADYDAPGSVVPVVQGRAQPLVARWGRRDLDDASDLVARGVRSLGHVLARPDVTLLDVTTWGAVASEATFADVDSPADLERLGLQVDGPRTDEGGPRAGDDRPVATRRARRPTAGPSGAPPPTPRSR